MASPRVQRAEAGASAGGKRGTPGKTAVPLITDPSPSEIDAVGGPASKRVLRSQGRRTMRKLLDAAMIAFDQRGYYDTRINDVVEIAKTSHGTFYLYFSNKEDLLRALVTEAGAHAQHLAGALDRPPELGGTPQWSDVRGWIALYSDLWIRYAPLFRAWTDLATIDPSLLEILRQTLTTMSDALERQIGLGAADRSIDPHTAGMAVMAMLDRFHYMREFVGQPVDEVALDTLATMIHRSLFEGPG
jgi:AcrR family transcriptional regulator